MLDLKNKVILVSKKIITESGDAFFDTYFGTVLSYDTNTVVVTKTNGQKEHLPYGEDMYKEAEVGFYELKDGSTYENPSYIAEFVVYETKTAYEKYAHRNQ